MQLMGKIARRVVVAFLALGFLALGPKPGFAFTNGQFNLIRIQNCITVPFSGEDFLLVSDAVTGGTLVLGDALAILSVLPICHPGGAFFAFLNNGAVTNVAVIPGL